MPKKYDSMAERLLANSTILPSDHPDYCVYNGTPCWEWLAKRSYRGYGHVAVRINGKKQNRMAHRLSIVELGGRTLPDDHVGQHLCNNTGCINPEHLLGGTQSENILQCVRDGRHNSFRRGPNESHTRDPEAVVVHPEM